MRLLFRQRFFSWFDSYDIYNDNEETVYTVKGQLSIGHCLTIYDANNNRIGMVQEKFLTFLPKFEIYEYDLQNNCRYIGQISKEFTFFYQDIILISMAGRLREAGLSGIILS